jgi:hypothetical protein
VERGGEVLAWARLGSAGFAKGLRLRDIAEVALGSGSAGFAAYRASVGAAPSATPVAALVLVGHGHEGREGARGRGEV